MLAGGLLLQYSYSEWLQDGSFFSPFDKLSCSLMSPHSTFTRSMKILLSIMHSSDCDRLQWQHLCFFPPPQLGGCGILGVGVWLSVTQGNFATLSSSLPSLSAANLLIAVGTIIMVIGCLGCVGAVKESRPILLTVSYHLPGWFLGWLWLTLTWYDTLLLYSETAAKSFVFHAVKSPENHLKLKSSSQIWGSSYRVITVQWCSVVFA